LVTDVAVMVSVTRLSKASKSICWSVALVVGLSAATAGAQPAAHADTPAASAPAADAAAQAEAKRLYQEGTKSFSLAEYADAITAYRAAYKLVPRPMFLFDIAQAYRLMGAFKQALTFYKSYLANLPPGESSDEVVQLIDQLEAQLKTQAATIAAPPHGPTPDGETHAAAALPTPRQAAAQHASKAEAAPLDTRTTSAESRPVYAKWWFWVGVTAVAGAVAVGVAASRSGGNGPSSDLGTSVIF
jgi:tetratricopeptide (TPR) repeat protein